MNLSKFTKLDYAMFALTKLSFFSPELLLIKVSISSLDTAELILQLTILSSSRF